MYITIQSIKRKVGFNGIELTDLVVGIPLFFILLLMFSFSTLRSLAIVLFVISVFMFIPINLSKKNRMYKIIWLFICYLKRDKLFSFIKESMEVKKNGIIKIKK